MFLAALLPVQYFMTFPFALPQSTSEIQSKSLQHIKCLKCIHIKAKGVNKYLLKMNEPSIYVFSTVLSPVAIKRLVELQKKQD